MLLITEKHTVLVGFHFNYMDKHKYEVLTVISNTDKKKKKIAIINNYLDF